MSIRSACVPIYVNPVGARSNFCKCLQTQRLSQFAEDRCTNLCKAPQKLSPHSGTPYVYVHVHIHMGSFCRFTIHLPPPRGHAIRYVNPVRPACPLILCNCRHMQPLGRFGQIHARGSKMEYCRHFLIPHMYNYMYT